jgi:hypothetical protein
LQLADRGLMDELRQGTRGVAVGLRQHRFLSGLVISEFALSLVLLVGAGLLVRSFWKVLQVQPGFETSHLVMAHLWLPFPDDPNLNPYLKPEKRAVFAREVLHRISGLPGVQSAVIGSANTPFSGQRALVNFTLEGNATGTGELPAAEFGSLTPDFSRTIGMPPLRDRSFTDAGKRILQNIQNIPGVLMAPQWTTIVGIVGRTKSEGLDAPYSAHIFVPSYQNVTLSMTIYVRTAASA